jgi:ferritin-like metal-binding protein YciE
MLRLSIPGKTSDIGDAKRCNFFMNMLGSSLKEEKKLGYLLPVAVQEAHNTELKKILAGYLMQVHKQAIRAEEILGILLMQPGGDSNRSVRSLSNEINALQHTLEADPINDIVLRTSIKRIMRNKIVMYNNLTQLALSLGMDDAVALLNQSLLDEKESDLLLSGPLKTKTRQLVDA